MIALATSLLLLLLECVSATSCSSAQMRAVTGSTVQCQPWPTVLDLEVPSGLQLVGPSAVEVLRCAGSCPSHSCQASRVVSKEVEVVVAPYSLSPGIVETQCTSVRAEEHLACSCSCPPRPPSCPSGKEWKENDCSCTCSSSPARQACRAKGWAWDPATCQCVCPGPMPSCPSSYTYDYLSSCSCVLTAAAAGPSLGLLLSLPVFAVVGLWLVMARLRIRKTEIKAVPLQEEKEEMDP